MGRIDQPERLWRYAGLARLWAWSLVVTAAVLLALAVVLQASSSQGLRGGYLAALAGIAGGTGTVMYPALRVWLRRSALPSLKLAEATRPSGARRLEASPAEWRRWAAVTTGTLVVGGAAMLTFLIGILGRGGTAEGVVVGVLVAWGATTLEDARRIDRAERAQGRLYYAACRRPTGVGNHLVWLPAAGAAAEGARHP